MTGSDAQAATVKSCIPAMLRQRARLQPGATAFTFVDYEQDWDGGVAVSLTWWQMYTRALSVAQALRVRASVGDRALILAPHGLEYVAAFLGTLQAGLIAVPLSVPLGGASDERIASVLRDTSPAVILTTASVVGSVARYAQPQRGESAPLVVYVDLLDLDVRKAAVADRESWPSTAYLQYTSGSTRQPAGVIVSYPNLLANFEQMVSDYFDERGRAAPPGTAVVSWLPFYHAMGLILGICAPILGGFHTVLMSPASFLQRPARWMQLLATNRRVWSAAPNFAYGLAAGKTTDRDMAGLDLGDVLGLLNGSERIHPATLKRFTERFAPFNLPARAIRPSYGLAEATAYVATRRPAHAPTIVCFESETLSAGHAQRCRDGGGTALVSYGEPRSPMVRIVNPDTKIECPPSSTGEIWVRGDNVAMGYWQDRRQTERTFGARLVAPSAGTPEGPWLRSGDLGFFYDGELFIMGRINDLLIVYGRTHHPDDIEATIQEVTENRAVAISVPDRHAEKLVVIIELKNRADSHPDAMHRLRVLKREVTSAISDSHGLRVADIVLVPAGSIPTTTSGKVRRSACVERYRHDRFTPLDVPVAAPINPRQNALWPNSPQSDKDLPPP